MSVGPVNHLTLYSFKLSHIRLQAKAMKQEKGKYIEYWHAHSKGKPERLGTGFKPKKSGFPNIYNDSG